MKDSPRFRIHVRRIVFLSLRRGIMPYTAPGLFQ